MKIIIYSILINLLIPVLCVSGGAFADDTRGTHGFGSGFRDGAEARALREHTKLKQEELELERKRIELERQQMQEELKLERQRMLLDACKSVWQDDPEQRMECVKDALNIKSGGAKVLVIESGADKLDKAGGDKLDKQAITDVKGWHKTHWGMSLSELEQTYQTNLKKTCKDDDGRCIYTLELVKLYGTPFDVEFYLSNGSNLNRITVSNEFKKENQLKLGERMEAELKKKYGNPNVLNDEREHAEPLIAEDGRPIPGMNILELQWDFPSTTITYYRSITKYLATNATVVHSVISLDYKASDHSQF
jgi:hypothetical protein